MKLSGYRQDYYYFSGQASNVSRQLAFAGIALVWVFKEDDGSVYQLASELWAPIVALMLSLTFDLVQYIVAAIVWGSYHRYQEKKVSSSDKVKGVDPEIYAPRYFNWPMLILYYLKICLVVVAYALMISYAWTLIKFA